MEMCFFLTSPFIELTGKMAHSTIRECGSFCLVHLGDFWKCNQCGRLSLNCCQHGSESRDRFKTSPPPTFKESRVELVFFAGAAVTIRN